MVRRWAQVALVAVVLVAVTAPGAAARWPEPTTAVIDWRMPDLTVDADGDGVIDRYLDGNRSADVPADGRYEVILDACNSANATWFQWTIDRRTVATRECATPIALQEGVHRATLQVVGPGGVATARGRVEVVTHVVLGLGDSYGAGSGAAVPSDTPGDAAARGYVDATCERTPRAHQAKAALELERSDPRSAVVFIHLACAGAHVSPGMLSPLRGNRPQVDQARDLLRGQTPDLALLSIGGNDAGFGGFVQMCLLTPGIDCPITPFAGFDSLHEFLDARAAVLRDGTSADPSQGLPALAACLGTGGCATSETPDGSGASLGLAPERVVVTPYPDITKGDAAAYCVADPTSPDPGLANASAEEWRWADAMLGSLSPVPSFEYTDAGGTRVTLERRSPGLNAIIAETGPRFGWSPVAGVYTGSTAHGYCASGYDSATGQGRWTFRILDEAAPGAAKVPVHPNAGGHAHFTDEVTEVLDSLLS